MRNERVKHQFEIRGGARPTFGSRCLRDVGMVYCLGGGGPVWLYNLVRAC